MVRAIIALATVVVVPVCAQRVDVAIPFRAVVGENDARCGPSYPGVGTNNTPIRLKDLRFYVHNVRLIAVDGREVPLELEQSPWQFEDVALLDLEDGSGACANGTQELNSSLRGTVPAGVYRGLRFTLGLPFALNHSDLTESPAPLNLSALAWSWNAGRKFVRIEIATTARPQGVIFHLGSTGCQPNLRASAVPTVCKQPNRAEIALPDFDVGSSAVVADLSALFRDVNLDQFRGCMSSIDEPDCAQLFHNLGLPWSATPAPSQSFFRERR